MSIYYSVIDCLMETIQCLLQRKGVLETTRIDKKCVR